MDQNLFHYAEQAAAAARPLCVSMASRVPPPDCCRGVFYQARATFNSTIRQHPRTYVRTRRSKALLQARARHGPRHESGFF
mmetsp:Transcript_22214/g.45398  ORF Transcript_22214/g.45398 Transcript_22214/m.45398 type:complete len:81 (-) Transcript_22214:71-313(-)